ncbi:MAG: hypothetical protein OXE57_10560 [Alphaproteobacteria bacterium]|nr:hypothetical protein [Alphaproteobacteria bacterium]
MKFAINKRLFGQVVRSAHAFGNSARTRERTDSRYPVDLAASPLGLEISAFDGNAVLTQRVPAGVSAPGSVSIDTGELRDALARANARDVVTFEARSKRGDAEMAACRLLDSGKATALGRAPTGRSGYCHMALGEQLEARLEAPAAELAAIVAETAFAASTDPHRPYFRGLFIESRDGRLRAVATDGSQMAIRDTNIPLAEDALPDDRFDKRGAILPLKPMRTLERLLKGGGSATVEIWTGGARFRCRAGEVATKFVNGTFPDYRRVLPAGRMKSAPLDLFALTEAVKAATPGARSARRGMQVTLNGKVTLTACPDSSSDSLDETLLPIRCRIRSDPIGFEARYLEDAGRAFGRVPTVMRYTKPGHPAVFVSPDRPELAIVQMPVRV